MRKDSWVRGALLSVLFFSLLHGSAPTIAVANVSTSAPATAHSAAGACPDGQILDAVSESCVPSVSFSESFDHFCSQLQSAFALGIFDIGFGGAAMGGAAAAAAKLYFASTMGTLFPTIGIVGAFGWGAARVARGLCKASGRW